MKSLEWLLREWVKARKYWYTTDSDIGCTASGVRCNVLAEVLAGLFGVTDADIYNLKTAADAATEFGGTWAEDELEQTIQHIMSLHSTTPNEEIEA